MKRKERGSALIIALIIVIIVVGIGGAFLVDTIFRGQTAHKEIQSDEAQMVADAALEKVRRALWVYKSDGTYDWDQIIADHAAMSIDPDDHLNDFQDRVNDSDFKAYMAGMNYTGMDTMNDAPPAGDPSHFLGVTMPYGEGGFMAIVRDNDDGDGDPSVDSDLQMLIYITATLRDGTQRQIEALVKYQDPTFTPDNAILVDGSILFNGTPDVLGAKGSAHANGDITLSGNPNFAVSVSATGVVNEGSAPVPPEGFNEGVPNVPIPDVDPTQYQGMATFILKANGTVEAGGFPIANTTGWSFSAGKWTLSGGGGASQGTYYIEGDAKMSGTGSSPIQKITVIATGSVETTGNIKIDPFLPNTAIVAGGDVKLGGTAGAKFQGLIAANEQIKTMGTFDHEGVLLAKNSADNFSLVTAGSAIDPDSQFGGTMTVTYNGGMETILENPSSAVSVQNLRRLK